MPAIACTKGHTAPTNTLGLIALVHRDEALPSAAIVRRVLELVHPAELSGTPLAVPVVNLLGAGTHSRHTPLDDMSLSAAFCEPSEGSATLPIKSASEELRRT